MQHNWKKIFKQKYYGDFYRSCQKDFAEEFKYFICLNCGVRAKSFYNYEFYCDNDVIFEPNTDGEVLTCEEIMIKQIIK